MAIKEEWSWDEFLGGLAKGVASGASIGINLQDAQEAAATKRLAAMRANPEPFLDEYDRRKGLGDYKIPIAGLDPISNAADLAGLGIPEPTQGINLMGAKEARDRQQAGRSLAFSDKAARGMEKISDAELGVIRREEEESNRQIIAEDIEANARKYVGANSMIEALTDQMEELEIRAREAQQAGNTALSMRLDAQIKALASQVPAYKVKAQEGMAGMRGRGITPDEFKALTDPGTREEAIKKLLRKHAGTTRTKRAGSR